MILSIIRWRAMLRAKATLISHLIVANTPSSWNLTMQVIRSQKSRNSWTPVSPEITLQR